MDFNTLQEMRDKYNSMLIEYTKYVRERKAVIDLLNVMFPNNNFKTEYINGDLFRNVEMKLISSPQLRFTQAVSYLTGQDLYKENTVDYFYEEPNVTWGRINKA